LRWRAFAIAPKPQPGHITMTVNANCDGDFPVWVA